MPLLHTRFFNYELVPGVDKDEVRHSASQSLRADRSRLLGRVTGHFADRKLDRSVLAFPSEEVLQGDYPFEGIDCDTFNPEPLQGKELAAFLVEHSD